MSEGEVRIVSGLRFACEKAAEHLERVAAAKDETTITLSKEERTELSNLLQLMTVMKVRLYMRGDHPDMDILSGLFEKLADAIIMRESSADAKALAALLKDAEAALPAYEAIVRS